MTVWLIGDVSNHTLAPCLRLSLSGFVEGHGGIARGEILADDMRAGEVVQEAADPAAADDAVQAVIDFGVDSDGEFFWHSASNTYWDTSSSAKMQSLSILG